MDYEAMHGSYAIAPAVLMENAGRAVAERAEKWIEGWDGKDVVLFCGKGNNGGDGFVIARYILAAGARAYVYILGQEADYSDEARQHLHTLQELADDETCLLLSAPESPEDWQLCGNGFTPRPSSSMPWSERAFTAACANLYRPSSRK